jgi:cytidylate kinase
MSDRKRILVVGHSGAGKDTACEYLAAVTRLRFAGTTSRYLARYVAARLGVPEQEAYRTRHRDRNLWHRVGNELRRLDPGLLVRQSLEHAEIAGGVRGLAEIEACRREQLVDLIVWVANDRVPRGSTVEFGERDCDVVVPNHWGLGEFHQRLLRLARFAGLPMRA